MKRFAKSLAAVLGVGCVFAAVAVAASSPTVANRAPLGVSHTAAILRGAVNPNGHETSWVFQYGVTTAYGLQSTTHSAGSGTKARPVKVEIFGLQPGTVYHYRLMAISSAGTTVSGDRAFKTAGKPPAAVLTGPAVNVTQNAASPTGSINPKGERTSWYVQYAACPTLPTPCNTSVYTSQTIGQTPILPGIAPVPVSVQLTGLAPGTLYHYRIVATHPHSMSFGNDVVLFTQPRFRRKPTMTTRTSPGNLTRKPYTFTTAGTLHGFNFIPSALRCSGRVGIRYYHGRKQVAFVLVPVGSNCRFSAPVSFRHLINGRRTALQAKIFYRGNGYLTSTEKTDHVTLG
jgi:hypothetical protein